MKLKHIGIALLLTILFSSYMKSSSTTSENTIFNFSSGVDISSWTILNDGVMGGLSTSSFDVNDAGHGVFEGEVSTLNNGGFASVRHRPESVDLSKKSKVTIRLKGDGKSYQFRVKKNISDFESFITTFNTSGKWETIEIDLADLFPSFRGRKLKQPNFDASSFEELSFLIANKKDENFTLLIDQIYLN
ncbi:MAG: CIA30 family protein [Crocinitomicaceae bacterium]|nr:CIA30 family protein [Crocinitomicaceae bacterium]